MTSEHQCPRSFRKWFAHAHWPVFTEPNCGSVTTGRALATFFDHNWTLEELKCHIYVFTERISIIGRLNSQNTEDGSINDALVPDVRRWEHMAAFIQICIWSENNTSDSISSVKSISLKPFRPTFNYQIGIRLSSTLFSAWSDVNCGCVSKSSEQPTVT